MRNLTEGASRGIARGQDRSGRQFGFDTVGNSRLRESWRSAPGQPAWDALQYQTRDELITNLARARRVTLR
jgi:hypothetical protein